MILTLAQHANAHIAIITFKLYSPYFEAEAAIDGNPWSVQTIEEMNANMKGTYKEQTDHIKRRLNSMTLVFAADQFNGSCGVKRIGNGKNKSIVNKAIFIRVPVQQFNEKFDFVAWHKNHGHKSYKTKQLL